MCLISKLTSRHVSYTSPSNPTATLRALLGKNSGTMTEWKAQVVYWFIPVLSRNRSTLEASTEESCQTAVQVFTQLITLSFRDRERKKQGQCTLLKATLPSNLE